MYTLLARSSRLSRAPRFVMSPRVLWAVITAIIALVSCGRPAAADGPTFDVPVHQFQVTGNVFGSTGFVDDFNSGSLAPNWFVYFGTASESGGSLHLTSPGTPYPYYQFSNVVLYQSDVIGPVALKGHGDFVARSVWDASAPQLNNYQFFAIGNGTSAANQEDVAVGVWNFDAATAQVFGAPGPGFAAAQTHAYIAGGQFTNETSPVLLDPSQITGFIVFQIAYNDTTDVVTTSFSLDGGVTFQSPFPTNSFPRYNGGVSFSLVTDPVVLTPLCSAAPKAQCRSSEKSSFALRHFTNAKKNTMTWSWTKGAATTQAEFGDPIGTAGYALCIYTGSGSSLIGQATIPASATRWKRTATGYRYSDRAATADGITTATLRGSQLEKSMATVKGKGAGLPGLTLPVTAPITVQLVNGSNGLCWGTTYTAEQLHKNTPTQLNVKAP